MDFTPAQREAIEYNGPGDVCVIAGPGSGKTRVLVSRFAWLARKKRIAPEDILAVTFTRKAALEMKRRLAQELTLEQAERAHVSTIDAFCAILLREHAIEAGLDPDFGQMEPIDSEVELYGWIEVALDQMWQEQPEAAIGFARAFSPKDERGGLDVARQLWKLIESARCWGSEPHSESGGDRHQRSRDWLAEVAKRALALFGEDKRRRSLLDFPDLTLAAVKLLRKGGASTRLRYKHVLLDENQDTNPVQAELMRLVQKSGGAPLFAVGDLNQSIYAFRNADPSVFAEFRDGVQLSGRVIDLKDNFRSRTEILSAARLLTKGSKGVAEQKLTAGREFAEKTEPSVELLISRGGGVEQEARWAARRIAELKGTLRLGNENKAPEWRDFAVLVRSNALLDDFASGLQWAGIPYAVNAGRSFFGAGEVKDMLALLRALDNPRDEVHLAAVLRSPIVAIADDSLLAMKIDGTDLFAAIAHPPQAIPRAETEKLQRFYKRFNNWRRRRESMPVNVLITDAAARTGFDAWLLKQDGGLQRSANVQKLAGLAGRAMESSGSFRKAVQRLDAMAKSSAGEGEATLPEDSTDAVRLMTVHAAKGLEFPVVVLGSVQNPGLNRTDSILYSSQAGIGVSWSDMEKGEGKGDPPYEVLYPDASRGRKDEDARLFYVGMTRAEDHLVLSAGFKDPVRMGGWATLIKSNLKFDPKTAKEGVGITDRDGLRVRTETHDQAPEKPHGTPGQMGEMQPQLVELRAGTLGQADSEASVTGVSQFAACPRRYYLSRYLGLERSAEEPSSTVDDAELAEPSAMELGRETHALLAGALAPEKASEQARRLAQAFEDHELGARVHQATQIEREREILFPVGSAPRLLRGIIDLHFVDDHGAVLVDYKTDRVNEAEAAAKAEEYALQMRLYALALELEGKKPQKAVLFFLRLGKAVDVSLDAQSLTDAVRQVEELFLAQESQTFPLKIAAHCRRCLHYRGLCPAQLPSHGRGQMKLFAD
jgi:ATP-dependent exoDNAse (exonuclease V) beta subunit